MSHCRQAASSAAGILQNSRNSTMYNDLILQIQITIFGSRQLVKLLNEAILGDCNWFALVSLRSHARQILFIHGLA